MYGSTRGTGSVLTFEEALFSGYLSDGGLVVPQKLPTVDVDTLKTWSSLSYVELVKKILPLFIPDNEIENSTLRSTRALEIYILLTVSECLGPYHNRSIASCDGQCPIIAPDVTVASDSQYTAFREAGSGCGRQRRRVSYSLNCSCYLKKSNLKILIRQPIFSQTEG
jgi:Threonine synthase N terminus